MNKLIILSILALAPMFIFSQDLTDGLLVNDLSLHPMEDIAKPDYLNTITDPSFNTTIRRITNAGQGEVIVPMYSTIQAWNADESLMILYNQSTSTHVLLDGMNYGFIRTLEDVDPADLEQIFWDFNNPDILYYPDRQTSDFVKYEVSTQSKQTLVNLISLSDCDGSVAMGNDVQMMSWDSDIFTFRCNNEFAYAYRISSGELTTFNMDDVDNTAPAVSPSGAQYYHVTSVYDAEGNISLDLNKESVEHSCMGALPNGNSAYFSIAFAEGPEGGCIGDIIAHDLTTGQCFPLISQSQGYDYPQSGTHISALAHKNTEGGWVAASMIGYDKDGQELLDQELVIVKADQDDIKVCRIGHHRSDEDEIDYWGEPHAVISPTGTRVLFASDWSGSEDGQSIDCYVVELPVHDSGTSSVNVDPNVVGYLMFPNPTESKLNIEINDFASGNWMIKIYDIKGLNVMTDKGVGNRLVLNVDSLVLGMYFFKIVDIEGVVVNGRFVKK